MESIIDRPLLEKLERLTIHWQKSFPGLVGGHNASRFAGPGQEFLDHRHFHHGDDLRAVNWRAYLRLEKMFLKMFQIEPRVPVRLLIDVSASMDTGQKSKFDYARRLAAALCYVALVRLDNICIQPYHETLGEPMSCGGGRHRFAPVTEFLARLRPGGRSNTLRVAREFIAEYMQRGLVVVISDFLDDQGCEKPLQYIAEFGHELLLVQVWSEEDRVPPWGGELELVDSETGSAMRLAFDDSARDVYTKSFDAYSAELQKLALSKGGRYVGLSTGIAIEDAIFGPLVQTGGIT